MSCIDIYKTSNGCDICGYNKCARALCFDHLPEYEKLEICKNGYSKSNNCGGMQMLYSTKYSVEELISEIKKCRILCHNCHMEQTYDKRYQKKSNFQNMNLLELKFALKSEENLEIITQIRKCPSSSIA